MKKKMRTVSLPTIVALVICVSIFLISALNIYQAYRGMRAGILSATEITAQYLVTSVNQTVKATFAPSRITLRLLAQEDIALATTLKERLANLPVFAEVLNTHPMCSSVFIGYESGDFFLLRRFSGSSPLVTSPAPEGTHYLLQTITTKEDGTPIGALYFYGESLKLLERRSADDYIYDPRTRPWFKMAMQSKGIAMTLPYAFFSIKDIGVTMAAKTAMGQAVIAMEVTVKDLSRALSSLRVTPASQVVIIDQMKNVVAYPDIKRLFVVDGDSHRMSKVGELGIPVFDKLIEEGTPVNTLVPFHDSEGDWYGLTAPIGEFVASDMDILIAIPSRELLAGVWDHLILQGVIAVGITIVLLLLGWRLGTQLVEPLRKLATQVRSLGDFDFESPIGVATRIAEVRELGAVLHNMAETISSFQALSLTLNKEQDLERMLMSVLQQLLRIVQMETGIIYLYDDKESVLRVAVYRGAPPAPVIAAPSIEATDEDFVREIQSGTGADDFLSILRNRGGEVIGVLRIPSDAPGGVQTHDVLARFIGKIAGSAAVAIETRQLLFAQKELLDSMIQLIADAIDTKSRYTGGHCKRVPILAMMMMDRITESQEASFVDYSMTDIQKEEFRIAAWLHDCGKITTPEFVVDKATKLEIIYNRIHEIRMRFEVLHRDASIACLEAIMSGMDEERARQIRDEEQTRLRDDFAFIAKCNIGGEYMASEDLERLNLIAQKTWERHFSDRLGLSRDELSRVAESREEESLPIVERLLADKPSHIVKWGEQIPPVQAGDPNNQWGFDMELPAHMYNYGEIYNLSLKKGTLTPEERFKINDHIVQTICMLSALPLPKGLGCVPDIAGNHHEQMNGSGYPRKRKGEDMTIPERVMAIADIFEALTASDRPYKEGKTLNQAMAILSRMAKEGHVDAEIFNLFLRSGIHLEYAERYLRPEQMDAVVVEEYLVKEDEK